MSFNEHNVAFENISVPLNIIFSYMSGTLPSKEVHEIPNAIEYISHENNKYNSPALRDLFKRCIHVFKILFHYFSNLVTFNK